MLTKEQLIDDFKKIGIKEGMVLVVHTSLRNIGCIQGGPEVMIESLLEVLGEEGTLVMPSMTSGDELFDPKTTPTDGMGIVAETFWRKPGVLRSVHPNSAFAAYGKHAHEIVAEHPIDQPEGIKSPIGKVFQLDGRILLLGVSHDSNTMIHLAESLNEVPYRTYSTVLSSNNGKVEKLEVPIINHCCQNFNKMESLLKEEDYLTIQKIGKCICQFMKASDVIELASVQLKKNPFYFLCEDDCEECTEAREYVIFQEGKKM
ncbi:AAC(3) family N-acetyltransferase [Lederbergia wuyishanensis]|uniref:Aminoglycoside N(3)-acetyltransferase n=1 Tax=Lederbergia wuyishanensis TaxID=1347903 RepID=A0ABU0D5J3_9BACI|nr:AAC(3) family N-acetyltransferase [Lederbergia wuyishanensis]MCJ8009809.1 AAC(3) family N-acetyltransferase [Lederbergia wuyishanensis]MDQ0343665.1 aminoglycoside 3-N-acetyltransferase [Lederbergia wuyishanensis]